MPENIYNYPESSSGSVLGSAASMGMWWGVPMAYDYTTGLAPMRTIARGEPQLGRRRFATRPYAGPLEVGEQRRWGTFEKRLRGEPANIKQLKQNVQDYRGKTIRGRWLQRSRYAGNVSSEAWGGFFSVDRGWGATGLKSRYRAAGAALEKLGFAKGSAPIARALLRAPLGFASAYMMWGSLIPASIDLGLGMFQEAAAEGARLRSRVPETVSNVYDMATRQQAFTMRQASAAAIHMSQLGIRASLGSEASHLGF